MKNNWKEEFEQQFGDMPLWRPKGEKLEVYGRLVNFIESLLAEQKKELLDLVAKEVRTLDTPPYPVENEKLSMLQDGAVIGFNDCRKDIIRKVFNNN